MFERIYHTIVDRPGEHDHVAQWRGRCTYCGHRAGDGVRQTREQPWRIPSEIVGRFRAMGPEGRKARDLAVATASLAMLGGGWALVLRLFAGVLS
jgi:hypothetical protein